jgi:AcrR family transcriptional regulator
VSIVSAKAILKAAAAGVDTADEPDGRRRRSQDSRARIVAAMLELVHAGEMSPSAEQVAERAEVGLRTVFRHFKDMDSLYGEMSKFIIAEVLEIVHQPLQGATWQDRLAELVVRRSQAFEKIAPYKRASNVSRHRSRFLQAGHARLVAGLREILIAALPPEVVADRVKLEALDMVMSYEAWSRLREEQGLTIRRARDVLLAAVARLTV